jgi:hypothetical protein
MHISSKSKCQLSFNWHLNLIEGCATQSRLLVVLGTVYGVPHLWFSICNLTRNPIEIAPNFSTRLNLIRNVGWMCLIYQYTYTLSSLMITLIHLIRHHINYHQSINQYSVFHFIKFLIFSVHRMEFSSKEFIWTVQKISKFLLSMCRIYSGKYPCFKHVYLSHIYNIIVRWHCYTRSGDT